MVPKTNTSLRNITTACAAIHSIDARTKYCNKEDIKVQKLVFSTLLIPIINVNSKQSRDMHN